MDENKIFLKTVEEKYERFLDYYTMMSSDFFSLNRANDFSVKKQPVSLFP